jgi:hypothetical protein
MAVLLFSYLQRSYLEINSKGRILDEFSNERINSCYVFLKSVSASNIVRDKSRVDRFLYSSSSSLNILIDISVPYLLCLYVLEIK